MRDVLSFWFSTSRHVLAGKSESANNSCRLWIHLGRPVEQTGAEAVRPLLGGGMHRKNIIYISNRGAPAPRRLAPGLLGLALLAPCLPASAQPAEGRPCDQIAEACRQAGFVVGAVKSGNGLLVDCVRPIMQNKPQPLSAPRPLPQIDPQLVAACKANNPDFGQAGAAPPSAPAAVAGIGG